MDKEKFVQRVENMLFNICGCSKEDALEVIKEVNKNIKEEKWYGRNSKTITKREV